MAVPSLTPDVLCWTPVSLAALVGADGRQAARCLAAADLVRAAIEARPPGVGRRWAALTVGELSRPARDGSPHGLYLLWLGDDLLYLGGSAVLPLHERLAQQLDGDPRGALNTVGHAMVRHRRADSPRAAVERLLAEGRVSLVPLGAANTPDARRVVRLLLLRLRAILAPLNLTRPRRTGVGLAALDPAEVVALDALEDRAVAAERVVREIGAVEADTELLDPTDAAGELLFVKVDRAWANARSPDVVLRWPRPLGRDRAEGVRLVAGVAAGEVVAAFRVAGLAEGPDGALGFRAERPLTPRECLDLERRLSGRQHGWSIKYLPA